MFRTNGNDIKEFLDAWCKWKLIFWRLRPPRVLSEGNSAHSSADPGLWPVAPSHQPITAQDSDWGANHRPGSVIPWITRLNDLSSHLEFISPPWEHFATRAMRVKLSKIPSNVLIRPEQWLMIDLAHYFAYLRPGLSGHVISWSPSSAPPSSASNTSESANVSWGQRWCSRPRSARYD